MVSRSDPGSFQRTTTCIWMPDVRLLHYFEPTQWGSVSGLDDGKRKTKRGWSPGDSLNLVRVLSVRVNYSQQCRNDINGRWEYSKSIIWHLHINKAGYVLCPISRAVLCLYFQIPVNPTDYENWHKQETIWMASCKTAVSRLLMDWNDITIIQILIYVSSGWGVLKLHS